MFIYVALTLWMLLLTLIGTRRAAVSILDVLPNGCYGIITTRNQKVFKLIALATFVFLWFITAFRSEEIGNDTRNYIYYFKIFAESGIDLNRTFELGYQALNVLIGLFTTDPHLFLIICASIMYIGAGRYLFQYSKNILVSLCLFFCCCFSFYTSVLRQGIAMIITLYAFQKLKQHKNIQAAVLILAAAFFHTTALIFFALYLKGLLINRRHIVYVVAIFGGILSMTGILNSILTAIIPRYEHYFYGQYASSGWLAVSYEVIRSFVFYCLISKACAKTQEEDSLVLMNFAFLLILNVFGYSVNLFTRASEYFLLVAMTELPNTLSLRRLKNARYWLLGICAVMLLYFIIVLVYRPDWNYLYPYRFWR